MWGRRMLVAHAGSTAAAQKLRASFKFRALKDVPMCTDVECPWNKEEAEFKIPFPFPSRLKNTICDHAELAKRYSASKRPPALFCSSCKCGDCTTDEEKYPESPDYPKYLVCRRLNTGGAPSDICADCGWGAKYPPCPTLARDPTMFTWRCQHKTAAKYVPGYDSSAQAAPKFGADSLVPVTSTHQVFLAAHCACMGEFATHIYVCEHQLAARNRAVSLVSAAPPGERVVLLGDWSEKLTLEPDCSATGQTYAKVGLLVILSIHKHTDGSVLCWTHAPLFEDIKNNVENTHLGLTDVVRALVAVRLNPLYVLLFSDGGPAHFKNGENCLYGPHLQQFMRLLFQSPALVFEWGFMQSSHGKGPYDAEGGLIKYYVRRAIRFMKRAFKTSLEVHTTHTTHTHTRNAHKHNRFSRGWACVASCAILSKTTKT